jgi:hypothetical protein
MPSDGRRAQVWELWYPEAGATGLSFARCRIEPTDVLWVHAAPPSLAVTVREGSTVVARDREPLRLAVERTPMTRLSIRDGSVVREDRWPSESDLGAVVVLPGGEAGVITSWWNAEDQSEWRWTVEFYNHV